MFSILHLTYYLLVACNLNASKANEIRLKETHIQNVLSFLTKNIILI